MNAIKVARAWTGRSVLAKVEGACHGTYDPAETSQDTRPESWGDADTPAAVPTSRGTPQGVLDDVAIIPFNDVERAERILRARGNDLAAVLVDVVPNRAGLVPASAEFLWMLRRVTQEMGAPLILDEVITFRLGYHGPQGQFGVDPDLTALGRVIGGGFPAGAIAGKAEYMSVYDPSEGTAPVQHGSTFSANPVTMLAGIAALEELTPASFDHLEALGDLFAEGATACFARHGIRAQVTGLGALRRIHMTDAPLSDFRSLFANPDATKPVAALARAVFDEGVLMAANGLMAFSTPMTPADVGEILAAFDRALPRLG